MNSVNNPKLTDGLILLPPLTADDAAEHLAGEDGEMAKWLSGGRSTLANVEAFIQKSQEQWRSGGPRRSFGIVDCATSRLIGFAEANLKTGLDPGLVNVSYGVFEKWRGQGVALRAINLIAQYLRAATEARQMVIRIAPANSASIKVAEKAGFAFCGAFDEAEGRLLRYVGDLWT
jgi:RimJ/RimL family protein N-acetyltransferase